MNGDWERVRWRNFCGGPVPEEIIRQYSTWLSDCQIYGASEVTGGITFWNPDMGLSTCHSAGKRLLGEIKVVDPESGGEVPPGEIGEIVYRGPQVTPGILEGFRRRRRGRSGMAGLIGGWTRQTGGRWTSLCGGSLGET